MQAGIEIVGRKVDRILVVRLERATHVDSYDERGSSDPWVVRRGSAGHQGDRSDHSNDRGSQQSRRTPKGGDHDATLGIGSRGVARLRSILPGRAVAANGFDISISSRVLNGSANAGRDCTTTTAKLSAAASSCSTGSVINSNRRLPSCWNHATSALSASIGARHMSFETGAGTDDTPL